MCTTPSYIYSSCVPFTYVVYVMNTKLEVVLMHMAVQNSRMMHASALWWRKLLLLGL